MVYENVPCIEPRINLLNLEFWEKIVENIIIISQRRLNDITIISVIKSLEFDNRRNLSTLISSKPLVRWFPRGGCRSKPSITNPLSVTGSLIAIGLFWNSINDTFAEYTLNSSSIRQLDHTGIDYIELIKLRKSYVIWQRNE